MCQSSWFRSALEFTLANSKLTRANWKPFGHGVAEERAARLLAAAVLVEALRLKVCLTFGGLPPDIFACNIFAGCEGR